MLKYVTYLSTVHYWVMTLDTLKKRMSGDKSSHVNTLFLLSYVNMMPNDESALNLSLWLGRILSWVSLNLLYNAVIFAEQHVITYPVFEKFIHILSSFELTFLPSSSRLGNGSMVKPVSNKYTRSAPWDAPEIFWLHIIICHIYNRNGLVSSITRFLWDI